MLSWNVTCFGFAATSRLASTMADAGDAGMEIDSGPVPHAGPSSELEKKKPRFEIKKYNAVALWAWGRFLTCRRCSSAFADDRRSLRGTGHSLRLLTNLFALSHDCTLLDGE
jgi:hypothetical protein